MLALSSDSKDTSSLESSARGKNSGNEASAEALEAEKALLTEILSEGFDLSPDAAKDQNKFYSMDYYPASKYSSDNSLLGLQTKIVIPGNEPKENVSIEKNEKTNIFKDIANSLSKLNLKKDLEKALPSDENLASVPDNATKETEEDDGIKYNEYNFDIDAYVPDDSELIFSYTLQGYTTEDYIYAYNYNKILYLPFSQLANDIGISYKTENRVVTAYYQNEPNRLYTVDLNNYTAKSGTLPVEMNKSDYRSIEKTIFFSADFLKRLFGIDIKANYFSMEMEIDGDKEFPTLVKLNAAKKRGKSTYQMPDRSFKDYEMDNRLIGMPVFDLQLGKSWGHSQKSHRYSNSDSYAINFSGIAAGLDFNSYFSGNSGNDRKPTIRLNAGRTFLDEPPNALNLKTLKMGDISGMSGSYFASGGAGRGISVSSFKNLVMSADKTIDIVGPLPEGWEVELYWNNMLVGYRQNSTAGEYNFKNIPVSYGLNTFKLVFYGPYGETRTEEKRYYSGTSPVAKGEIGYTMSAYQPGRYLFENNQTSKPEGKDIPIYDANFYYGLSDDITLISGVTHTPDAPTKEEAQNFAMLGAQYAVKGSSIQYNLEKNLDYSNLGHHLEWQGDVYIGTLYASYDDYNRIHSPRSYYGDEYLKTKTEFRFSGSNPWRIPYTLSYRTGKKESDNRAYEDITARISRNLAQRWYISIEDTYSAIDHTNEIKPSLYHYWDDYTWQTDITYKHKPENRFTDLNSQLTWRSDRYTYYTLSYRRDIQSKMDYYSISGSRIFPFGGLSLSASIDKEKNFSTSLNYNISFAKEPDRYRILTSANSQLAHSGSIYVMARDETGAPVEGVGLTANNLVKEVYTDEHGNAFLTDLSSYEKTILNVDLESIGDLTLKPMFEQKKLVLRPGTLKIIDLPFSHVGTIEGQIANPYGKRLYGYKIAVVDANGKEVEYTFADLDGYFLMEDVPYGDYKLVVSKDNVELTVIPGIKVDDFDLYLEEEIYTPDSAEPDEPEDDEEESEEIEENEQEDGVEDASDDIEAENNNEQEESSLGENEEQKDETEDATEPEDEAVAALAPETELEAESAVADDYEENKAEELEPEIISESEEVIDDIEVNAPEEPGQEADFENQEAIDGNEVNETEEPKQETLSENPEAISGYEIDEYIEAETKTDFEGQEENEEPGILSKLLSWFKKWFLILLHFIRTYFHF